MTVKELAVFTGKNETTIQRWVKKAACKMQSVAEKSSSAGHGKITNYTIDEVEAILSAGSMSKDAVAILMQNARGTAAVTPAVDYRLIGEMITAAVTAAISPLYQNIPAEKKGTPMSLPAPVKSSRDALNQAVHQYAVSCTGGDHREAWHVLYEEIYYRLHVNIRMKAKRAGVSKLDIIEELGLLESSVAIMQEMIGE